MPNGLPGLSHFVGRSLCFGEVGPSCPTQRQAEKVCRMTPLLLDMMMADCIGPYCILWDKYNKTFRGRAECGIAGL